MARIRRKAAERADTSRRCLEDRDRQLKLQEKPGNIPVDVQLPQCFWPHTHFPTSLLASESQPKFHVEAWNLDVTLKPFVGVVFLDIKRVERYGIIKLVNAQSVEVFTLYNKSTVQEVLHNLSATDVKKYKSLMVGMKPFECFQSMYSDEVPTSDILGIFQVTYPFIALPPRSATAKQHICVVGWVFFEDVQRKEVFHIQRFKGFRVSTAMLNSYFTNIPQGFDYFQVTNILSFIRQELYQWLDKRGSSTWNPRKANRLAFDVAIQDVMVILSLLKHVCLDTSKVMCSSTGSGFTWTVDSKLLETDPFKQELNVPLKGNPYRLGPARGTIYLEGPLHIKLPQKQSINYVTFQFSKIVRMGCNDKLMWDFPPTPSDLIHTVYRH
eukprot:765347-Hanusia_phi.AAC.2